MHGIKRTRLNPQAAEAKRLKELGKIETYVALQEDILARKTAQDYSAAAFKRTTDLLDLNPEFYTIWNYRRNILSHGIFPSSSQEEVVHLLTGEVKLTTAYLHVHPKVYWIWNHRKWCLENVPLGPEGSDGWRNDFWKVELKVVEKMLEADARNFHAWGYRRYVLSSLPASFTTRRTPQDELRYTQRKIESNFSNFSAWHTRTKVLGAVWEGMRGTEVEKAKDEDFELVRQALWTDPGDQSGWLYHRWLVGSEPADEVLKREIASIRELHEAEPDSKWCMNALAQYTLHLSRLPSTPPEESTRLRDEARGLLGRLEEVDIDRKERYRDLAKRSQ